MGFRRYCNLSLSLNTSYFQWSGYEHKRDDRQLDTRFLRIVSALSVDTLGDGSVLAVLRRSTENSCSYHQLQGATGHEYQRSI